MQECLQHDGAAFWEKSNLGRNIESQRDKKSHAQISCRDKPCWAVRVPGGSSSETCMWSTSHVFRENFTFKRMRPCLYYTWSTIWHWKPICLFVYLFSELFGTYRARGIEFWSNVPRAQLFAHGMTESESLWFGSDSWHKHICKWCEEVFSFPPVPGPGSETTQVATESSCSSRLLRTQKVHGL